MNDVCFFGDSWLAISILDTNQANQVPTAKMVSFTELFICSLIGLQFV